MHRDGSGSGDGGMYGAADGGTSSGGDAGGAGAGMAGVGVGGMHYNKGRVLCSLGRRLRSALDVLFQ